MSIVETIYLDGAIVAFLIFALTLSAVTIYVAAGDRRARRLPGAATKSEFSERQAA